MLYLNFKCYHEDIRAKVCDSCSFGIRSPGYSVAKRNFPVSTRIRTIIKQFRSVNINIFPSKICSTCRATLLSVNQGKLPKIFF